MRRIHSQTLRLLLAAGYAAIMSGIAPVSAEPWPYYPFHQPHPLGNHFGTYQNYGGSPYYHDGLDLVTPSGPVDCYSVSDGTVTHITHGDPYYSGIMIGEPVPGGIGWLYWHISSTTFPYDVGDAVQTNDYIGTVAWWPVAAFHHVHFNKVEGTGGYPWSWYIAIDNPLLYMEPHTEEDPPEFHDTYLTDRFVFARQGSGQILDAMLLTGEVDIVSRISDIVGLPQWSLNPYRIEYWIDGAIESVPHTTSVEFSGVIPTDNTVSVIYRTVTPLITQGNYDARVYYFIVTNTDGDGYVETSDADYFWDTDLMTPGDYWVYVRAEDCAGLVSVDSMLCSVQGPIPVDARMELPEDSHDFGIVPVTLTDTWQMAIINNGSDHLSIRSITSDEPVFGVNRSHFYVAPDDVEIVNVSFTPTAAEEYAGNLEIQTNDPRQPVAHVSLAGVGGDPSAVREDGYDPAHPVEAADRLAILGTRAIPGGAAEVAYTISRAGEVTFTAFDPSGRRVREVSWRARAAGSQSWTWDGKDGSGRLLPVGTYFFRLRTETEQAHGAALLMR